MIGVVVFFAVIIGIVFLVYEERRQEADRRKKWIEYRNNQVRLVANAYLERALTQKDPMVYLADHYDTTESGGVQEAAILTAMNILILKSREQTK